jgi:uncharacterized protein YbcI
VREASANAPHGLTDRQIPVPRLDPSSLFFPLENSRTVGYIAARKMLSPETNYDLTAEETRVLCREVVAIWKETVGRGPTYASAYAGPASTSIVLRNVLTQSERILTEQGEYDHVREARRMLFDAARASLISAVERSSGRPVETALYDVDPVHDTCALTFIFALPLRRG